MSAAEIVNKIWNYAHLLRALQNRFAFHQVFPELRSGHDGVGYGDYVEQITYLIFLKMADEREQTGIGSSQMRGFSASMHSPHKAFPGQKYAWASW